LATILSQILTLLKDKEPNLTNLLNPLLRPYNIVLEDDAIVKTVNTNLQSSLLAGEGVTEMAGQVTIEFERAFSIKMPDQPTLKIEPLVVLTLGKNGLPSIKGVMASVAGPFGVGVSSVLWVGDHVEVKAGPVTQKIALPKALTGVL